MVRMFGIRSISFSRLCDNGFRLTHQERAKAKRRMNAGRRVRNGTASGATQPALAASQAIGSMSPPLTCTSKWR